MSQFLWNTKVVSILQIQRLTNTWHTVRQKFTDSAFNFESKLRSTLKAMNECTNPQAPNTTIPHILPFMLLCERDLDDIYAMHKHVSVPNFCIVKKYIIYEITLFSLHKKWSECLGHSTESINLLLYFPGFFNPSVGKHSSRLWDANALHTPSRSQSYYTKLESV